MTVSPTPPTSRRPVLIAHRGASGYRPEHTLASYELAARMGADYLEPDVVSTADGVLVCRHENEISGTTDIARRPDLADRRTTKVVDGTPVTGWFTEDLTLAELRTLRAVERLPHLRPANQQLDGRFGVPTLAELLALRARLSRELERPIGVYIEAKHPSYFADARLALEEPLAVELHTAGLSGVSPEQELPLVYLQCFELGSLRRMRRELGVQAPAVLLVADPAPAGMLTPTGLVELARDVEGVGPEKSLVLQGTGQVAGWVRQAHAAGLVVHPWTFRAENQFLPAGRRSGERPEAHGDVVGEMLAYLRAGVDGVFTDHPDLGVRALAAFRGDGAGMP